MLGGPIGIYEVDRYPFLKQELATIEAAVKKGVPVIGICLGCQALAAVLAARVYPNSEKELGWDEMTLTDGGQGLAARGHRRRAACCNWHGDTFDLPVGATRLASTEITPNQAFTYGAKVLALQFHVELPERDLERWLIGHTLELVHLEGRSRQDARRHRALRARRQCRRASACSTIGSTALRLDDVQSTSDVSRKGRREVTRAALRLRLGHLPHRLAGRRRQLAGVGRLRVSSPLAFHQVEA